MLRSMNFLLSHFTGTLLLRRGNSLLYGFSREPGEMGNTLRIPFQAQWINASAKSIRKMLLTANILFQK